MEMEFQCDQVVGWISVVMDIQMAPGVSLE